jgi:hypothetical protein
MGENYNNNWQLPLNRLIQHTSGSMKCPTFDSLTLV